MPATTTDRSEEGHAETAGSVESHIGPPTPSLLVLHPGAPQRHSQIRRSGQVHRLRPWTSAPSVAEARPFILGRWHDGCVAVTAAVKTSALSERPRPSRFSVARPKSSLLSGTRLCALLHSFSVLPRLLSPARPLGGMASVLEHWSVWRSRRAARLFPSRELKP